MPKSKDRPSPSASATLFKVGTIKKGNDGNAWIIYKTSNGIKRWKKYNQHIKIKNKLIYEFILPKIKNFKKIGTIKISSKVSVGELSLNPSNGFSKFGKGDYNIYDIDGNMVLSKKSLTKAKASKLIWKHRVSFGVDTGTFGFWDNKKIKDLNKFRMKYFKKRYSQRRLKHMSNEIPDIINFNVLMYRKKIKNSKVKIKDFDDSETFIDHGFNGNTVVGMLANTGIGDGYFSCYSNKDDALLLLGGRTGMEIMNNVQPKDTSNKSKRRSRR